jgi:hypothetical protein
MSGRTGSRFAARSPPGFDGFELTFVAEEAPHEVYGELRAFFR